MDTDEEPSGLSLSQETETGHVEGGAICIVVGLYYNLKHGKTVKFLSTYRKSLAIFHLLPNIVNMENKPKFHPNPKLKLMDQVREVLWARCPAQPKDRR